MDPFAMGTLALLLTFALMVVGYRLILWSFPDD